MEQYFVILKQSAKDKNFKRLYPSSHLPHLSQAIYPVLPIMDMNREKSQGIVQEKSRISLSALSVILRVLKTFLILILLRLLINLLLMLLLLIMFPYWNSYQNCVALVLLPTKNSSKRRLKFSLKCKTIPAFHPLLMVAGIFLVCLTRQKFT